jgi:5'-deoxynucleotidase YfbR-like HD superfamily hydrolase
VLKLLKLALIHDLPEALVGDTPYNIIYRDGGEDSAIGKAKSRQEREAMESLWT